MTDIETVEAIYAAMAGRDTDTLFRLVDPAIVVTQDDRLPWGGRFEGHDGFDGMMLGRTGWPFHLEFTRARAHPAGRAPGQDNLLVFYLPDDEWRAAVERMQAAGLRPRASLNPWWDRQGATFEDPDGYRVVLQQGGWEP